MAILINFKICDNVPECPCIEKCPVNAISYDKKEKKLITDNDKCTNCGICEDECPVGAMRVAKTQKEYKEIEEEIKNDPRKVSDLFMDKYGSQPLDPDVFMFQKDFSQETLDKDKLTVIELYKPDLIECLLRSIPLRNLFPGKDMKYKKIKVENDSILQQFNIKQLPCLLFFNKGQNIGKIQGYYDADKFDELKTQIDEIIAKI